MARWRSNWGKRAAVFGVAAIIGIAGFCIFSFSKNQEAEISYKETQVMRGNITNGITESGSVIIGTVAQELKELDNFDNSASKVMQGQNMESSSKDASALGLEVEEVYLAVGETAKAGDKILKLDAESVTEYRETLEDNCRLAELALSKAKLQSELNAQAIKSVEARQKYEETLLNRDYAGSVYAIDTADVDSAVEEAEESLQSARDALSYFQALVGDGTIYARYGGTVFSVGYEAGDVLSSSTGVAEFADSDNVTITVSVSLEDISAVEVGSEAEIVLTAYADKTYAEKVKSVDTSSSSGMPTVSYDVAVLFTDDVSDVYQDMTGNVTFIASRAEEGSVALIESQVRAE